jgi:hypothetical protein
MVKLRKEDTADLDIDELDAIEYSTDTFDTYDGDIPPKDIELGGYVKKMWWTRTQNNDPMIKVLWVAAENDGDNDEYNGCPFWLNAALIGGAKFRWAPFLDNFGITLRQVKNNTDVEGEDDQFGAPINKIGSFRPGEGNDEAWCRIITDREKYNGEWQPRVKEWLPWDDDGTEPADEAEDEEPEDEEYEEEEEPEPEPEPARTRGGRSTRAAARSAPEKPATRGARGTARTAAKTPEKAAPARGARGARTAAKPAATPARGRGRARGSSEDPPF